MTVELLPPNILRSMSPEDRRAIGKSARTPEEIESDNLAKSEKQLQKEIANLLRLRGIWFDQDAMHKRRTGTRSTPDFLFALNGQAVAFEVKVGKAEPTLEQLKCHEQMRRNGWYVFVVRSLDRALEVLGEGVAVSIVQR